MSKYFKNITSYKNLKSQYVALLKKHHPDNGGNVEDMQEINCEYSALFAIWKGRAEKENTLTEEEKAETASSTKRHFYTQNGWEGSRYDSSLSLKEIAKIVRNYVKEKYPTCKFSVRTSYASMCQELHVEIKEFPSQMYKSGDDLRKEGLYVTTIETDYKGEPWEYTRYIEEVNQMERKLRSNYKFNLDSWHDEDLIKAYEEAIKESTFYAIKTDYFSSVLDDVNTFVNSFNYNDSDGMIDYFDVNFYYLDCKFSDCVQVEKVARIKNQKSEVKRARKTGTETTKAIETEVETINTANYTYEVSEDTDTRTNEKIYLVKVAEKLSREEYIKVNNYIKSIGGYYSRFKHAFLFKENPTELLNGEPMENATETVPEEPITAATEPQTEEKPEEVKEEITYTITEDKHDKTNETIFIVKPTKELSKADFAEVKRKFATLKGFYSGYKHGFIFKYNPTEAINTA